MLDIMCIKFFSCFSFIEKRDTNKYIGVSWIQETKKWLATVNLKGKRYYIGSFQIEEDAAKAVNLKCQELNIPLKNPSVEVLNHETLKKLKTKVSSFLFNFFQLEGRELWESNMFLNKFDMTHFFVFKFFITFHKRWALQIDSLWEKKTCYNFDNNFYCYLVLKVWQTENNVGMDIIFLNLFLVFLFENTFSSKYVGVCWIKENRKWLSRVQHNGETHSIGYFEIEEDAAKAVNLKCQELNIQLKNPGVGVLDNDTLKKLKVSSFLL